VAAARPVLDDVGGGELVIVVLTGAWTAPGRNPRLANDGARRGVRLSRNRAPGSPLGGRPHAQPHRASWTPTCRITGCCRSCSTGGGRVTRWVRHPPLPQGRPGKRTAYRAFYRIYRRLANIDARRQRDFAARPASRDDTAPRHPVPAACAAGFGYRQVGVGTTATPERWRAQVHGAACFASLSTVAVVLRRPAAAASYLGVSRWRVAASQWR
jgi:hypothetical protein